jgi:SAM-dependent methyltransferase
MPPTMTVCLATFGPMKTLDASKKRFDIAKNMMQQSRRATVWRRNCLKRDRLPVEDNAEVTELEEYMEAHQEGPGIDKWKHYLPIYERHFEKFKGRDVHVVEIGVFSGGSLGMWRQYFGPNCHVYGVDISEACRVYTAEGIDIFIGDQADPSFWTQFMQVVPQVDIVIDDGGHQAFQQIPTLEALLPHIRPGGVYLCEDVHGEYNSYLDYLFGLSRGLHTFFPHRSKHWKGMSPTVFQQAIDSFHFYPFVAVIEKRATRLDHLDNLKRGSHWQPQTFWDAQASSHTYR